VTSGIAEWSLKTDSEGGHTDSPTIIDAGWFRSGGEGQRESVARGRRLMGIEGRRKDGEHGQQREAQCRRGRGGRRGGHPCSFVDVGRPARRWMGEGSDSLSLFFVSAAHPSGCLLQRRLVPLVSGLSARTGSGSRGGKGRGDATDASNCERGTQRTFRQASLLLSTSTAAA
jgi:hypothetical protein